MVVLKADNTLKHKKPKTHMDDAKQQLATKLKSANNILVTVSRDPSVDQLAALLGLTLLLNKQGKHAVAVFSGQVPSTIEFLQPEETIEKTTDSLRDFIIALDKSKADKLRYKVEDNVVRIFITPYKTSISEKDFDFSEGDFNVDVVVALGVRQQEELDDAITAHGRILHDATVASIDITTGGEVGTINWQAPEASSLSELVTSLSQTLGKELLDEQIATALLTGIVSATNRFSNDKTSPQTMSMSAVLMTAGANQQLVTSKLAELAASPPQASVSTVQVDADQTSEDGTIEIDHQADKADDIQPLIVDETPRADTIPMPEPAAEPAQPAPVEAAPAEPTVAQPEPANDLTPGPRMMTEPPSLGGTLTANSTEPGLDPVTDPFSMPASEPPQLLDHSSSQPPAGPGLVTSPEPKPEADTTLAQLEETVDSPHVEGANLNDARSEVNQALGDAGAPDNTLPEPIQALNAQPMGDELHTGTPATSDQVIITQDGSLLPAPAADQPADGSQSFDEPPSGSPPVTNSNAPPPVPPPIPFQFGGSPPQS